MPEKLKIQKPVAIVGLGLSGKASLKLLLGLGLPQTDIATFDTKDAAADFQDPRVLLTQFKPRTLVVSPGVPLSLDWILNFRKAGGAITSELSLATHFLDQERVIGVTGSVGKSTCVELLGAAAKTQDPNAFVGGNFGFPLADYISGILAGKPRAQWIILELSSYQLENYENLKTDVSVFTSLTENHLERYPDLQSYYMAKWFLALRTKSLLVLNTYGGDLKSWVMSQAGSIQTPAKMLWVDRNDALLKNDQLNQALLIGSHNQDNLALAATLCHLLQWSPAAIEALKKNRGLAHRLENLGEKSGVLFINDSKATTIESVQTAISSLLSAKSGQLHIFVGGRDKNLPWQNLVNFKSNPKIHFHFFGECAALAQSKSHLKGTSSAKLGEALDKAKSLFASGDLVLLSPGGTSLDEFKNFEERGNFFRAWVERF